MISQRAAFLLMLQIVALTLFSGFVLESSFPSEAFVSPLLRMQIVELLGGTVHPTPGGPNVQLNWLNLLFAAAITSGMLNAVVLFSGRLGSHGNPIAMSEVISRTGRWAWPLMVWSVLWLVSYASTTFTAILVGCVNLVLAAVSAGWVYEVLDRRKWFDGVRQETSQPESQRGAIIGLTIAMGLFTVIFVGMNWGLWFNLRIPHGDSVMYEEHLWNVLHGKGFRSYLDQGLFWGEHIQFAHLFLIPLYVLWPSHLLLELSETVALASAAIPVYFLTRKFSGNSAAAFLTAIASLLYFPMHYLDIAIDLKTFRPISYGVPCLLWGILAAESRRWIAMIIWMLLALSSKEDYAIVIAPFGLWMALHEFVRAKRSQTSMERSSLIAGSILCVFATVYLAIVVKVAIPYFRNWGTVHYVRYFEAFGSTPTEIVWNILFNPSLLFGQLVTLGSVLYFFRLLLPLGMPFQAWSRLLVALPLFILLCLNTLAMQPPGPYHHFHAPIVPILIWAAASAVSIDFVKTSRGTMAKWVVSCALTTCILFGFSPLSIRFWDPGSEMYWKALYIPNERAQMVNRILKRIPERARVASTDYVHSRLTHLERSYDYSKYPRRVADYEDRVPLDTDLIILDRTHPYSIGEYDDLSKIRELVREPDQWELLPDETHGHFAVLKRKSSTIELK